MHLAINDICAGPAAGSGAGPANLNRLYCVASVLGNIQDGGVPTNRIGSIIGAGVAGIENVDATRNGAGVME